VSTVDLTCWAVVDSELEQEWERMREQKEKKKKQWEWEWERLICCYVEDQVMGLMVRCRALAHLLGQYQVVMCDTGVAVEPNKRVCACNMLRPVLGPCELERKCVRLLLLCIHANCLTVVVVVVILLTNGERERKRNEESKKEPYG